MTALRAVGIGLLIGLGGCHSARPSDPVFPAVVCPTDVPDALPEGVALPSEMAHRQAVLDSIPAYAGLYIDGDTSVVLSTSVLTESEVAVVLEMSFGSELSGQPWARSGRNEIAPRSLAELWTLRIALTRLLEARNVTGIGHSERDGNVHLYVPDRETGEALRRHVAACGCPLGAVTYRVSTGVKLL